MMSKEIKSFVCSEDYPVVQTKEGKVRGYESNGIFTFLGIRYATAARFESATPITSWDGIVDTQDYGFTCPQIPPHEVVGNLAFPKRYWPESEDCLNLNIWTNHINDRRKKPVIVWLHGGGFATGSSVELECYDGENMARYGDVVCISLNHRLNILGFLDLSDYGAPYQLSGIAGMEDIVCALKWIKENIAEFGGDPDNVTIFGESGGGGKVRALMQMGSADGLYSHAIVDSGVLPPESKTPQEQKSEAKRFAKRIVDAAGGLERLLVIPYHDILTILNKEAPGQFMNWNPVPCTGSYKGEWYNAGFREETLGIPLIVGSTFQELMPRPEKINNKDSLTQKERIEAVIETFGKEHAVEIGAEFKKAYPELNLYYCTLIDYVIRIATRDFCLDRVKAGGSMTWNFLFAFETRYKGGLLSTHADELPFVFHNAEYIGAMFAGEETAKTESEIFNAWISFAANGDPNHLGIGRWLPVSEDAHHCFVFSSHSSDRVSHDDKLMDLVDRYRIKRFGFGPVQNHDEN